jgi:hypothetical protein
MRVGRSNLRVFCMALPPLVPHRATRMAGSVAPQASAEDLCLCVLRQAPLTTPRQTCHQGHCLGARRSGARRAGAGVDRRAHELQHVPHAVAHVDLVVVVHLEAQQRRQRPDRRAPNALERWRPVELQKHPCGRRGVAHALHEGRHRSKRERVVLAGRQVHGERESPVGGGDHGVCPAAGRAGPPAEVKLCDRPALSPGRPQLAAVPSSYPLRCAARRTISRATSVMVSPAWWPRRTENDYRPVSICCVVHCPCRCPVCTRSKHPWSPNVRQFEACSKATTGSNPIWAARGGEAPLGRARRRPRSSPICARWPRLWAARSAYLAECSRCAERQGAAAAGAGAALESWRPRQGSSQFAFDFAGGVVAGSCKATPRDDFKLTSMLCSRRAWPAVPCLAAVDPGWVACPPLALPHPPAGAPHQPQDQSSRSNTDHVQTCLTTACLGTSSARQSDRLQATRLRVPPRGAAGCARAPAPPTRRRARARGTAHRRRRRSSTA